MLLHKIIKTASAGTNRLVFKPSAGVVLRVINANNSDSATLISIALTKIADPDDSDENISLVHRQSAVKTKDISWKGREEMDGTQKVVVRFDNVDLNDTLAMTVGWERT